MQHKAHLLLIQQNGLLFQGIQGGQLEELVSVPPRITSTASSLGLLVFYFCFVLIFISLVHVCSAQCLRFSWEPVHVPRHLKSFCFTFLSLSPSTSLHHLIPFLALLLLLLFFLAFTNCQPAIHGFVYEVRGLYSIPSIPLESKVFKGKMLV